MNERQGLSETLRQAVGTNNYIPVRPKSNIKRIFKVLIASACFEPHTTCRYFKTAHCYSLK